jgi:RimJ/RimL family protein N-acetyltransferase
MLLKTWDFVSKDGRPIVVRHAEPRDARKLHSGFEQVVNEGQWLPTFFCNSSIADWVNWIERTRLNSDVLILAEIDGEYAGHLTLQPEEWMASSHVAKLGIIVVKEHRNKGVGRSLMLAAEDAAREKGFLKIILSTFESNTIARPLYTSLGFRTIGVRERHFMMAGTYIDEVLMEKWLE